MSEWLSEENRPVGWFSKEEGQLYEATASQHPGGRLVELGCYLGRSLSYILPTCKRLHIQVYAVDVWDETRPEDENPHDKHIYCPPRTLRLFQENLRRLDALDQVTIIQSDSVKAANQFEANSINVIMVDTLHTEQHTLNEINAWWPKLKTGGDILFHDYDASRRKDPTRGSFVLEAVEKRLGQPDLVTQTLALIRKKA